MTTALSKYFNLEEATFSETGARLGIKNEPTPEILLNMKAAAGQLDVLREDLDAPMFVSSWLRVEELNKAVGGSNGSDHMIGWAIDCRVPGLTPLQLCLWAQKFLESKGLKWNQIIHEYGRWMHISFHPNAKCEVLTIFASGAPAKKYVPGLLSEDAYLAYGS